MIKDAESNIVLTVENAHTAACGRPPSILHSAADDPYVGFFANRFGEQWVVVIEPETKTGVLRGGDIGWSKEVPIKDGQIVGDLMLGIDEAMWLQCCWRAACGEPLKA